MAARARPDRRGGRRRSPRRLGAVGPLRRSPVAVSARASGAAGGSGSRVARGSSSGRGLPNRPGHDVRRIVERRDPRPSIVEGASDREQVGASHQTAGGGLGGRFVVRVLDLLPPDSGDKVDVVPWMHSRGLELGGGQELVGVGLAVLRMWRGPGQHPAGTARSDEPSPGARREGAVRRPRRGRLSARVQPGPGTRGGRRAFGRVGVARRRLIRQGRPAVRAARDPVQQARQRVVGCGQGHRGRGPAPVPDQGHSTVRG